MTAGADDAWLGERVGMGCMALTGIYGSVDRSVAFAILRRALERGVDHFDTAELYGPFANESLLADALGRDRHRVTIATKVGYAYRDGARVGLDSRPASLRRAVEGSLRRLRLERVDLLYQHRPDPAVPTEEAVGALAELVQEGKVAAIGLSDVDADTFRRAATVLPIAAVQVEYSLLHRAPELELLPAVAEAGGRLFAYSPLGRGLLAGGARTKDARRADDYRRSDPRFEAERLAGAESACAALWEIAYAQGVAPAARGVGLASRPSPSRQRPARPAHAPASRGQLHSPAAKRFGSRAPRRCVRDSRVRRCDADPRRRRRIARRSSRSLNMKGLDASALRVGDIVLTASSSWMSRTIQFATGGPASHAMVYVEDHSVIDATAEGVQARNTQRIILEDDCVVHVLRARDALTASQAEAVCSYVRARVGTQYATTEAVRSALGGGSSWTAKQFCSRLVAQAFASAGVHLSPDPNYCAPADLLASSELVPVADAIRSVSVEEANFWSSRLDLPALMRAATNAVLDGSRRRDPGIQNFNDLNQHLLAHPEDDAIIVGLLQGSGYLSLWAVEQQKNSWQYDLALLSASSREACDLEEYCRRTLAEGPGGADRYASGHGAYVELSALRDLRTFAALRDLYARLATLQDIRKRTARAWLVEQGLMRSDEGAPLSPHTDAWFAALSVWNPPQAIMARAALIAAGRSDVCSVCGDEPAHDYRLAEAQRPPAGVDTLRLCGDCLAIREDQGEIFVPFKPVAGDAP